jgi:hypothetical protein
LFLTSPCRFNHARSLLSIITGLCLRSKYSLFTHSFHFLLPNTHSLLIRSISFLSFPYLNPYQDLSTHKILTLYSFVPFHFFHFLILTLTRLAGRENKHSLIFFHFLILPLPGPFDAQNRNSARAAAQPPVAALLRSRQTTRRSR